MAKNSLLAGNFGAPIGAVDGAGIGAFAAIRCISEAELSNFNRLVLIFCVPRAPAREASTEPRRSFARPNASAPLTAGPKPR
jgi:hypothetical protein